MATSFYFYDLETSGINPREARVMQFAGQRTDMNLKPIGEPHNILIKLSDDTLPEPDAIFVTGITPQQTLAEGITEAEFLKIFHKEIATPGTIFTGFNTVRFDDEFMRYMQYRNFYDPYEWQYVDGNSRWDILDLIRMTRALRPDGIKWPVDGDGKATNRLELLTKENAIDHVGAHDALSDVRATIAVAQLVKTHQPKLFEYLLQLRDKKAVAELLGAGKPFLYTSGKYAAEYQKTTIVAPLADHPKRQGSLVYDLRVDPTPFASLTPTELVAAWTRRRDDEGLRLPIKTLQFNRCPAVAPLAVLDDTAKERLGVDMAIIQQNYKTLQQLDIALNVLKALELLDAQQHKKFGISKDVDEQLYDGFIGPADKQASRAVRAAAAEDLAELQLNFSDARLTGLFPRYKARNYPSTLSDEERAEWEAFRTNKLMDGGQDSRMARYFKRLAELAEPTDLSSNDQFLLEELQLYGQSIMPVEDV